MIWITAHDLTPHEKAAVSRCSKCVGVATLLGGDQYASKRAVAIDAVFRHHVVRAGEERRLRGLIERNVANLADGEAMVVGFDRTQMLLAGSTEEGANPDPSALIRMIYCAMTNARAKRS